MVPRYREGRGGGPQDQQERGVREQDRTGQESRGQAAATAENSLLTPCADSLGRGEEGCPALGGEEERGVSEVRPYVSSLSLNTPTLTHFLPYLPPLSPSHFPFVINS